MLGVKVRMLWGTERQILSVLHTITISHIIYIELYIITQNCIFNLIFEIRFHKFIKHVVYIYCRIFTSLHFRINNNITYVIIRNNIIYVKNDSVGMCEV